MMTAMETAQSEWRTKPRPFKVVSIQVIHHIGVFSGREWYNVWVDNGLWVNLHIHYVNAKKERTISMASVKRALNVTNRGDK